MGSIGQMNDIPSPCFVLEEELFIKNLNIISGVAKETGVIIIPAFKAFAMWGAFHIMKPYVEGAAASGLHEARLAYEELGVKAHTFSPAFIDDEFQDIMRYSSHITFNSINQFNKYYHFLKDTNISSGLRVNPGFSPVATEMYNPCVAGSRLGITHEELGGKIPAGVEGIHFHVLCENDASDLENVLDSFGKIYGSLLSRIQWLNMGGGHLMTRKNYNINKLIELLKSLKNKYPHLTIYLEPGSAYTWETGFLIATIIDVVNNKGIKTAILDMSFTAHTPDCLEMPYKPRIRNSYFDPVNGKPTYRMGGNSCLAGDFIGSWSFDNELQPGDKIIFEDMIHYTMVKTTTFNGVSHPSIGIIKKNGAFQLIRKFGYEDYKKRLS